MPLPVPVATGTVAVVQARNSTPGLLPEQLEPRSRCTDLPPYKPAGNR